MDSNNNQIEEIKNRLDIVQIVGKYVQLKQAGKNFSGLCPFHKEKTPSFIVSPDIQRYKCFGCGESGDMFNFVQRLENIDFPETLEKLAKEAGVKLEKFERNSKYTRLEELNYLATKYFFNQLKLSDIAKRYLRERNLNDESIKIFGIGYAPKYSDLLDYVQKNSKYSKQELLESGLFVEKEGKIRDKFHYRIMFPIRSSNGKVVAFSGRVLPGNDWGPKYMNSPETPIFHKKDNLFGQYESRQEVRKQDLAILCEGQTDVISAHQNDIKNIVAPLGTGITKEQIEKLSKLSRNFLFFFDSDEAGFKAVIRAFKLSSELGVYPYAATPSPYKDIDELIQKDKKLFQEKIKQKIEAFSFILSSFLSNKNLSKLRDVTETTSFIQELLASVQNPTIKDHYLQKANKITSLKIPGNDMQGKGSLSRKIPPEKQVPVKEIIPVAERAYLELLLLLEEIPKGSLAAEELFSSENIRVILSTLSKTKNISRKELYDKLHDNPGTAGLVEELIFQTGKLPQSKEDILKEIEQVMSKLKKDFYNRQRHDINIKIAIAEENGEFKKSRKLLEEMQEINKILRGIEND